MLELLLAAGAVQTGNFTWFSYGIGVVSTLGALAVKKLVENVRHRRVPHCCTEEIRDQAVPADMDQVDLQSNLVSLMVSPDDHGMFVIAAPPGVGKTKILAKAMSVVKERGIPILYVNGLTDHTLPDLGISTATISGQVLAKGSVFVIDQMDDGKDDITTSIKRVLLRLATESSNSRMFKVIVVVSKVNVRDLILELNSGEKIVAFNQPREFFWTVAMLEQLCELRLPNWPTRDRQRLTALVSKAGSPALLMGLCHSLRFTHRYPYGIHHHNIKKKYGPRVGAKLRDWKAFDQSRVEVLTTYHD